jgi:lipoprotein-releasing system permease protein
MTFGDRLRVALRYTFPSGSAHLSTFLSSLSMVGLVLAISLLIIVLSVMNGFDKEMRERILSLVPHISVYAQLSEIDTAATLATLRSHPQVASVSPFVRFDTLVIKGSAIETAQGIGLSAQDLNAMSSFASVLQTVGGEGALSQADSIILGSAIAQKLGAQPGDALTLVVPAQRQINSAAGATFRAVRLQGVLHSGTELDETLALVSAELASRLAGLNGQVSGFRVTTTTLFDVQQIGWELSDLLGPGFYTTNWMMTHGNLYAAIQLSRSLVSILLFSIIAVAAFNVVSSLVLVVMDKQGNIAILRTLGASSNDVAWIFMLQGAMIGTVGVVLGSAVGAVGSSMVPTLVAALERQLGIQFLSTDVYPVSFLPVDVRLDDILWVGLVAFTMCVVAAIYPSRRAARLAPALVLNQDR